MQVQEEDDPKRDELAIIKEIRDANAAIHYNTPSFVKQKQDQEQQFFKGAILDPAIFERSLSNKRKKLIGDDTDESSDRDDI